MKKLPTLYKIDTTGKVREWTIYSQNSNPPKYVVTHGAKDGAMQVTSTDVPLGRNPGKANERSAWEQCQAEALSQWTKKMERKGYALSVDTNRTETPFSAMLAKSYNKPGTDLTALKDGHKIKFPCRWQPKLDGIRCNAMRDPTGVELQSRQHKPFPSMVHIAETLKGLVGFGKNLVLDGELYRHGEEFQELASFIRKDKPTKEATRVQYHIYDVFDKRNPDWIYDDRRDWLNKVIRGGFRHLQPVFGGTCNNMQEVEEILHKQIKRGYEGIMLRNADGVYSLGGRSKDLQKVKLFIDQEFEIVGAYENKGKMRDQCTFECVTKEGYTFGVKPEGNEALREQYWTDFKKGGLTGKMLTVRFFAWTTSAKSVPRFPVGVTVRDYE